jgi:kinetochore protein Spc25, fungi type
MATASYTPRIDLSIVLAAQNPLIDLRSDEFERSMRSSNNLVANYSKKKTAAVVEKKTAYNTEKSRLTEKIQTTRAEINQCKETEIELMEGGC